MNSEQRFCVFSCHFFAASISLSLCFSVAFFMYASEDLTFSQKLHETFSSQIENKWMWHLPYVQNDYAFDLYMLLENTLELIFILCIRLFGDISLLHFGFFLNFNLTWISCLVFIINDILKRHKSSRSSCSQKL